MRELSRAEYMRLFKTTDDNKIRRAVDAVNIRFRLNVSITTCFKSGRPIVYREQLPAVLKRVLEHDEAMGVVYVGGYYSHARRMVA